MFEASLVESSAILRTGNRWPAVISTAFYTAIALALVSLPMLRPDVLSVVVHPLITFTPPRPHIPPPPPPQVPMLPSASNAASTPLPPIPTLVTRTTVMTTAPVEEPNFSSTTSMTTPGIGSILGNSIPAGPVVRVGTGDRGSGPGGSTHHGPVAISQGVSAGLLLAPIQPLYPRIAIAAHKEGTVVVQAIISRTGLIESAHVISGPMMLQGSALDAVRSARYRPYLLNGQPTEVDTTFSINFQLGSSY